jgi:membrane-associated phospholipid phosphatase
MPPLSAQDALSAVQRGAGWRWLDLPVALADVASEPWVVALIALALFAWLEYEVKDVVKAFLPLGVALLAATAVAFAARALGAVPRPVGEGGPGATSLLLWRAFPAANVAAVAVFAAYALLAYGRRARGALVLAASVAVARALSGPHWVAHLVGGAAAGAVLGAAAYAIALRLWPEGHLARLRGARRRPPDAGDAVAERPSA